MPVTEVAAGRAAAAGSPAELHSKLSQVNRLSHSSVQLTCGKCCRWVGLPFALQGCAVRAGWVEGGMATRQPGRGHAAQQLYPLWVVTMAL